MHFLFVLYFIFYFIDFIFRLLTLCNKQTKVRNQKKQPLRSVAVFSRHAYLIQIRFDIAVDKSCIRSACPKVRGGSVEDNYWFTFCHQRNCLVIVEVIHIDFLDKNIRVMCLRKFYVSMDISTCWWGTGGRISCPATVTSSRTYTGWKIKTLSVLCVCVIHDLERYSFACDKWILRRGPLVAEIDPTVPNNIVGATIIKRRHGTQTRLCRRHPTSVKKPDMDSCKVDPRSRRQPAGAQGLGVA